MARALLAADANLILQMVMGVALFFGAMLARMKKYAAHAICQTLVLLINTVAIAWVMWPSFQHSVFPRLPRRWMHAYYVWPAVHGALGGVAEVFGLYIALVAGTNLLPKKLKLRRWKFWMRFEVGLWWLVLLSGLGTYLSLGTLLFRCPNAYKFCLLFVRLVVFYSRTVILDRA